tara:strand:+ start:385 stop:669 length:285 start_codon:yes stop_codon:yes gene_type:complete
MKILNCPLNGPRNISEFAFGGEVVEMPATNADVREWADYVFSESNTKGLVHEWWMHVPSTFWFIAERNTETNEIIRTYTSDELYVKRAAASTDE